MKTYKLLFTWGALALASNTILANTAHAAESEEFEQPHRLELDATVGGRFGGALDVDLDHSTEGKISGRVSVDSSAVYGGILSYRVQRNGFFFLNYSRQDTTIRFRPNFVDLDSKASSGSIEYFQAGGNLEATRGRVTPYFGVSVGASRFSSRESSGDAWRFTAALDGGVKFRLLSFLHLRLLGRVPFTFSGGELYCYTGYGCAVVSDGAPFVQGEIQAAIGLDF